MNNSYRPVNLTFPRQWSNSDAFGSGLVQTLLLAREHSLLDVGTVTYDSGYVGPTQSHFGEAWQRLQNFHHTQTNRFFEDKINEQIEDQTTSFLEAAVHLEGGLELSSSRRPGEGLVDDILDRGAHEVSVSGGLVHSQQFHQKRLVFGLRQLREELLKTRDFNAHAENAEDVLLVLVDILDSYDALKTMFTENNDDENGGDLDDLMLQFDFSLARAFQNIGFWVSLPHLSMPAQALRFMQKLVKKILRGERTETINPNLLAKLRLWRAMYVSQHQPVGYLTNRIG